MMLPENLGHLFDVPLRLTPDAVAAIQDETTLTYGRLEERVCRMANVLVGLGVGGGDRVALMFGNDWRFLEAFFAPMRLGAVSVPLNIRMGDEALAYVLEDAEAKVLIAGRDQGARARTLAGQAKALGHLLVDGPDGDYAPRMEAASPRFRRRRVDPEAVCMQPYTSGSTGRPKGVLLAHRGQIWNADVIRKMACLDHTERALVAVPLYHKNAMIGAVKPFLLCGGSLVILPGFDPVAVIRAIDRHRVTYLTGVPAMYKLMLAEQDALATHDVRSVRYALCGSAEVPEELLAEFQRVFGAPIAESYGLTEGGPVPCANPRYGLKKRGSCGVDVGQAENRILRVDGSACDVDEVGELVCRNPGLAKGYWKLPEVTAQKLRDGWLHTGDLMRRDRDGYYYFVGRKDDMINVAGENVYPKEVEDLLLRHPGLKDACVVPASHATKGWVPVAYVVARDPAAAPSEEALKRFFLERGAPYAHPRRVVFLDRLPLGGTGKLDRAALKRMAAEAGPIESAR
ncbi:MAG: acyl--CoA ligase [Candidatus Rokubacteria bacterium]|nr:acyl--CoA ligase [Candidatus Rokubacteria bacterium]